MRFLQLKVKLEAVSIIREVYETRVIPELQKIKGCTYAALIRGVRDPETVISMTLWQRKEEAEAWGKNTLFQNIMKEAATYLSKSSVKSYAVKTQKHIKNRVQPKIPRMCTRIEFYKVQKKKIQEFNELYNREIIPALQARDGCIYAWLLENMQEKENGEVVSVTTWESREKAAQYEMNVEFEKLVDSLYTMITAKHFK
jgi:heme-degrading monooxygenase HmoA